MKAKQKITSKTEEFVAGIKVGRGSVPNAPGSPTSTSIERALKALREISKMGIFDKQVAG